jgi:hypothetical protein
MQKNLQFESAHACLLVRDSGQVFVQVIDSYRFQRELVVTPTETGYTIHVYQHPGRREITTVSRKVGGGFIARLIERAEKYPSLLFNVNTSAMARSEGFVHLCESLFRGEDPKGLLD